MPSPENPIEVKFAPEDVESLQRLFAAEWRFRRAFVAGMFSLRERERCQLRLVHPNGGTFSVEAEVVYRKAEEPGAGIGLDLVGLDAGKALLLEMFALSPTTIQESSAATPAEDPATAGVDPGTRTIYAKIRALSFDDNKFYVRDESETSLEIYAPTLRRRAKNLSSSGGVVRLWALRLRVEPSARSIQTS